MTPTRDPLGELFGDLEPDQLRELADDAYTRRRQHDLDRALLSDTRDGAARPRHPVPRRHRKVAARLAATVAAAAVATAIAVPMLDRDQRQAAISTRAADAGRQPADARQFLLAMADRVVRLPAGAGAYWHKEQVTREIHTFGSGGKSGRGPAYTVQLSQVTRSWTGASRWRVVTSYQEPRFLTKRDRANWRKAGAPELRLGEPSPGKELPANPSVSEAEGVPVTFPVGDRSLTMTQLQRLPSDPARLAAWLRAAIKPKPQAPSGVDPEPGSGSPDAKELLFATAAELLDWPVPHQVRAAAFKILAGVDGARLLGQVTDPIGRTGTGVAFPESSAGDRVFIVDAATAELLAMQYIPSNPARFGVRVPAGTATLSVITVASGWVDKLGQRA